MPKRPDEEDAGALRRSCTAACIALDTEIVSSAVERTLGVGRHPIAASSAGFAFAFVESPATRVGLTTFDVHGAASEVVRTLDVGATAVAAANPVVATVPSGHVAAWTDYAADGDGLGVALAFLESGKSTFTRLHANVTTAYAQHDPDLISTGSELLCRR